MRRCLITGSHGFVGRRFVKHFADCGDEVTCIDNMVSGVPTEDWVYKPQSNERLRIHFADCRQMLNAMKPSYFDLVVHCAAIVGGRLKIDGDTLAVATDLSIDAEFFNWVVRGKRMPKVIYFSSSAAYPIAFQRRDAMTLDESMIGFDDNIRQPDMTYGWAKLSGEYLAKFAMENYGLDVHVYRPFGGYGDDQSFDYPFPTIIRRIVNGEDPVMVWGSGDQRRDFIYIDDVIECVMCSMDAPPGTALNIGSGVGTSFRQLAERACKQLHHDALVRNDPSKPEGVFNRVADISKMSEFYTPRITLEEGIDLVAHRIRKANGR